MGVDAIFDSENWSRVPFHFWTVVFFVFGSIVGSFLNVVIHRLPLGQSVVSPPSHCPHCKYSIPWYLNLPLLTWLWLGGKCRNCGAPISMRYFLVELLTAAAFSSCWLAFGDQSVWLALVFCLFLSLLIAGSFIDLEHFIIPDEITIGGLIAGFGCSVLLPRLHGEATLLASIGQCLLGAGVGAAVIYGIVRAGKLFLGRMHFELDPESRVVFD
jgi:leader peptidase (prepilin peptidase)/N-methyltransferase